MVVTVSPALAHDGAALPYGSFLSGLTHPVLGLDHFLAMVSVGILSAQMGGRAIWTVPATFVGIMAFGGLLGWIDVGLSAIEVGIAFSVLALGTAIAADKTVPLVVAMSAVGVFAIFHGYAHGAEMPVVAQPVKYAMGFMTGTALLHLAGVLIGDISQHYARGKVLLRISGAAIAAIGGFFLYGAA
ncbi:MAG: HupE/UreJ family protein [Gammaproteobacteria bacterium]|nr:HupE/UreJ family protein [Gammaproteobacteria bacterium]NND54425.1 HupE/UreJ family protein [Gammaproteobacteria bacterium]